VGKNPPLLPKPRTPHKPGNIKGRNGRPATSGHLTPVPTCWGGRTKRARKKGHTIPREITSGGRKGITGNIRKKAKGGRKEDACRTKET